MPNRNLTPDELAKANVLLAYIREQLDIICGSDAEFKFALRRKISKELGYDERSKPMIRRGLKAKKMKSQDGLCAICEKQLKPTYNVLDRLKAVDGYTVENTRLICESCDRKVQADRKFS